MRGPLIGRSRVPSLLDCQPRQLRQGLPGREGQRVRAPRQVHLQARDLRTQVPLLVPVAHGRTDQRAHLQAIHFERHLWGDIAGGERDLHFISPILINGEVHR